MAVSRRFVVNQLKDRLIHPGNSKYCAEILKFLNEIITEHLEEDDENHLILSN